MRLLSWLLRAFIFFTLFAFALNNQHLVSVHWFFGVVSQAPMVLVVLAAFVAGCVLGTLAMLPGWWRRRTSGAAAATINAERETRPPAHSSLGPLASLGPSAAVGPLGAVSSSGPLASDTAVPRAPRQPLAPLDEPDRAGA